MIITTKQTLLASCAFGAFLFTACGDDGGNGGTPDAAVGPDAPVAPDGATPDGPTGPSCEAIEAPVTTLSTFPATYEGDLAGATAAFDINDDVTCVESSTLTGQQGSGPDQLVKLTGLTAGTTYYLKLRSTEDLAAYVTTGCDTATALPAAGECLAFVDVELREALDVITFVAPADGVAYVIVDFWSGTLEIEGTDYTLSITTEGCLEDADCTSPTAPVCSAVDANCASVDYCVGDDATAEAQSDDALAGATPIDLTGGPVSVNANVCSDSTQADPELDHYSFTVPNGGAITASLSWADTAADLQLGVLDAAGNTVGISLYQSPETVAANFLAAGTYYVVVGRVAPDSTAVTPYTLVVTPDPTELCTVDADCGEVFQNQLFRPKCDAGACVELVEAATVPLGGACDSSSDCVDASDGCINFEFMAEPHTRSICTVICTSDDDCTDVGAGYKCTAGGNPNFCMAPCTADNQCPSDLEARPASGPWTYATCVVAEGRCNLQ